MTNSTACEKPFTIDSLLLALYKSNHSAREATDLLDNPDFPYSLIASIFRSYKRQEILQYSKIQCLPKDLQIQVVNFLDNI